MKIHTLAILAFSCAVGTFAADTSVTLKNVHLCCEPCVKGAERAVEGIKGITMKADEDSGTVTLAGSEKAQVQKAANALAAGGYFGANENSDFKPVAQTGAKGEKVQSLVVSGAHLCCAGCVKAVDRAVRNTPGAAGHTAKKNAERFMVNGNFNDQAFFEALHKEGLSGKIVNGAK